MKFDLRINPGWKVIDVKTGLSLEAVRWVDDATHEVAWCQCARSAAQNPNNAAFMALLGATPEGVYKLCTDDRYVKQMPKVKIDQPRKTILVNVDESIKPEEPVDEGKPLAMRGGERILVLIAG